ncbi:MAG: DUF72 domain-containing protein [Candidatus Dormibacteria bacterium]
MPAPILIGTSNWADHKNFYPPELERGGRQKEKLSYYSRFFPMVEVDTTFYGIPKPPVVEGWLERTPESFRFNVKAYRSLTRHEREGGRPRPPTPEEERDFLGAIAPLRAAGRLLAIHYQFPPWFKDNSANREILMEARDRHPDDIVAIEFRHRSWFDADALPRTEELLRELDATMVGVDAPQIGDATAPAHLAITSPRLALVRFHGRNRRTWYIRDATSSTERFDYLYAPAQLAEWAAPIRAAAARAVPVHVLMNNNRDNYAVVNAFDMARLLDVALPEPPPPIAERMRERDAGAVGSSPHRGAAAPGQASLPLGGEEAGPSR